MSDPVTLALVGIGATFALMALHVPIGVAMGLVGVAGYAIMVGLGPALSLLANEPAGVMTNLDLAVIPLFLLMGSLAGAAGLAGDVYNLAYAFVGHRKGGLAMATLGGSAGFGSVCGSGIATAATFGRVALPEMLARGYAPSLATGVIASGGTLGILIPPSTIMVIYAVLTEQFIVDLFTAAVVPAIIAILLYFVAILGTLHVNPGAGPAGPRMAWPERLRVIRANWGIVFLATVVLGGIYSGIFTVTEAAAVGVTVAFLFALGRRKLTWPVFLRVLAEASATTAMIYVMIFGASIFSYSMTITHAPGRLVEAITGLEVPGLAIIFVLLAAYVVLGAIFDEVAAMVITLPFVLPLIQHLGYDLIWWGIINVIVIEIGMICPPIGINVFVLHGMNKTIPVSTIYRGIAPFLAADVVRLGLLTAFPMLTLWLPHALKN